MTFPLSVLPCRSALIAAVVACTAAIASTPAMAQDAAAQGSEDNKPNTIQEVYKDWRVECAAAPAAQNQAQRMFCRLSQELYTGEPRRLVLRLTFQYGPSSKLYGTLLGPFGLALAEGVRYSVDDGDSWTSPFQTCVPQGCLSRFEVSDQRAAALRRGQKLAIHLQPFGNGKSLDVGLSLSGFTAGSARLQKLTADYRG